MQLEESFSGEYAALVGLAKTRSNCYLLFLCLSFLHNPFAHITYVSKSGKIFLPAVNIRSQLLSFHGITIKHMLFSLVVVFLIIFSPSQQICHRDLKLENTLLDGSPTPQLKICDFGYSKVDNLFHIAKHYTFRSLSSPFYVCSIRYSLLYCTRNRNRLSGRLHTSHRRF